MITVRPGGRAEFIHDDRLNGLLKEGQATLQRASHVEPGSVLTAQHTGEAKYTDLDPLKWYADLAPVDGPLLGPHDTRQEALDDEVEWLNNNHLGTCNE